MQQPSVQDIRKALHYRLYIMYTIRICIYMRHDEIRHFGPATRNNENNNNIPGTCEIYIKLL